MITQKSNQKIVILTVGKDPSKKAARFLQV